jgi:hypothetical protein
VGQGPARGKIIPLEQHRMIRLPSPDRKENQLERAAFVALNLVALVLVGIALNDSFRFAANSEQIEQALSGGLNPPASVAQGTGRISLQHTQQTAGALRFHEPKS